jgi:DNA polymerase/3'-5' exonuclease PolX
MEKEKVYPWSYANEIANRVVERLKPHCERIEIAGSIRRKKASVGDIEILCIPKKIMQVDLFGEPTGLTITDSGLIKIVAEWEKVKGDLQDGKYTQRVLPECIKLDLFTATYENWGLLYAIRTGPADYSHNVLARRWANRGYESVGGVLCKLDGSTKVELKEEEDLFEFLGLAYVKPENRQWPANFDYLKKEVKTD